jgi:hypothetical protein
MKTLLLSLLIGLLICSFANGQDAIIEAMREHQRDMMFHRFLNEMESEVITTQDIFDYQKECYADSFGTMTYFHRFKDRRGKWREYSTNEPPDPDVYVVNDILLYKKVTYTHRAPTFEGFIEYVKTKLPTP